jgi:DNA-binding NarL/FixJ family response regulator
MAGTAIIVAIADDNLSVRQGVRSLLEGEPDFQVIGEAGGGLEAIQLVQRVSPDILIVDLVMPDINGLEVIRRITECSPKTRAVVLSVYGYEGYVVEAFRFGARAYVLKDSLYELADAIRAVMQGSTYLSSSLSESTIQSYLKKTTASASDQHNDLSTVE